MDSSLWTSTADWPPEWTEIKERALARFASTQLSLPASRSFSTPLQDCLEIRSSDRSNVERPLRLDEIATILSESLRWKSASSCIDQGSRRPYPSAGARFPIDCHVIILRVEGVSAGVYSYRAATHSLIEVGKIPGEGEVLRCFGHEWIAKARAVLVLSGDLDRTTIKYAERGYRFALIECGHIMQNLCLIASALDIPFCPVGGFADAPLKRIIRANKPNDLPLYAGVLP